MNVTKMSQLDKAFAEALRLKEEKGYLLRATVLDLSDEYSLSENEYNELSSRLEENGVPIKDDIIAPSGSVSSQDGLSFYFSEMGKYPMLTKEEEIQLGEKMELGKKAEATLLIDKTDEKNLQRIVNEGRKARETLITSNLRLVIDIASQFRRNDVPFSDLIQNGNEGLIHAVDKFDYTRGFKFSTYATWWIKQAITRGIGDAKNAVRIPTHKAQEIARLKKNRAELSLSLGKEPSDEELIEAYPEWNEEKINELDSFSKTSAISLNEKVGEEEDSELGDLEADENSEADITRLLDVEDNMRQLAVALSALSSQEKDIVSRVYGLSGKDKETGESIAKDYHVSRERIRQIKEKALRKMREAIENDGK